MVIPLRKKHILPMEKETHFSNCILNGSCWLQRAYFAHLQNVWNVLNFILLICYFFLTKPWKWVLRTLDKLSVGPFWMLTSFIHSGVNSQGMLLESFYCSKSSGESLRTNWHWDCWNLCIVSNNFTKRRHTSGRAASLEYYAIVASLAAK